MGCVDARQLTFGRHLWSRIGLCPGLGGWVVPVSVINGAGAIIQVSFLVGAGGIILVSFSVGAGGALKVSFAVRVLVPSSDPSSARSIKCPPMLLSSCSCSFHLSDGVGGGSILLLSGGWRWYGYRVVGRRYSGVETPC